MMLEDAAVGRARRTPQQRLDARHEHAGAIRLGNEVVGTHGHAHDLVDLGYARGEHDDGDLRDGAELAADELAVGAGQRQVEQHEIGAGSLNVLDNVFEGLAKRRLEAVALKHLHELAPDGGIVFDYIDEGHGSTPFCKHLRPGRMRERLCPIMPQARTPSTGSHLERPNCARPPFVRSRTRPP